MQIQLQTKFCLLCVLSVIFPQSYHCHEAHTHHHDHHHHHHGPHRHHNHSDHPQRGVTSEEEQQFYITQLFQRYGSTERLDFAGFQSLLLSLGLGEVKLVEMDHEELGHDHVAHLDILDVQDGRHSHADGHHGHHGHQHEASGHQHVTEQVPTQCTRTTSASPRTTASSPRATSASTRTTASSARSGLEKHDTHKKHDPHLHRGHSHGDHHHHHHHHHHHQQPTDNAHDEKLQNGPTEKDMKDNHDHTDSGVHDHGDHSDHAHNDHSDQGSGRHLERTETEHGDSMAHSGDDRGHLHKFEQDLATSESQSLYQASAAPPSDMERKQPHSSTLPPAGVEQQLSPAETEGRDRKRKRKGRGRGQAGDREAGGGRRKREVAGGLSTPTASALIGPAHSRGSAHQHEECLNLTQLLTDFGLSPDSLISPVQFSYLCPALLYQIDRRLCLRHYHNQEVEQQLIEPPNSVMVWVSGFVSITIISLLSLLGVVLVPILNQGCFKFLLTFLVALAVGTLSGDALLHLLPHSQGQHDHSSDRDQDSDLGTEFDGVWKGLMALGGIYLLFIIEHCLGMYKHYKEHKSSENAAAETVGRKLSDHKLNRRSDAEWLHLKALPEDSGACDNSVSDTQVTEVQSPDSASTAPGHSPKKNGHKAHGHSHGGHGHSHGGHCHSDQDMKEAGIASIAWMVIMGDGMHNFSDGLAIGAAFSANVTGGISTSVAVFCHELPHELGDFAVLLKAGMSVKQALVYNVLSALMAYIGMVIGTAVGQYTHNVTSWIFAITAGMFLYVALVDMLPEMLHGDSEDHKRCQIGHFLLQNLGMLSGFCIMLLIAIYEDQIVFDFKF